MPRRYETNHDRDTLSYVRLARIARGMSQRDLEEASQITHVGISHIESGRSKNPHIGTKRLLAEALEYDVEDLFPKAGPSPSKELRALARKETKR